ncbi:ABC transporter ATP-binding protein [Cumulibacter soli]|uniref:ABC transporter ATP-binding protein n=1 Tax=Cumulibacter soli TaxID=2546344 RepID=UPI0010683B98|nr:ABC transporter ATP-binding protein [Cumulibacter soli]
MTVPANVVKPAGEPESADDPIVSVRGLTVEFKLGRNRILHALNDVSIELSPGQTLGVIGESGSGKSTLARAIMGLSPIAAGEITIAGMRTESMSHKQRRRHRGVVQMVFQDPSESLDPRLPVAKSIAEPLTIQHGLKGRALTSRVAELLDRVGLSQRQGERKPRDLSGGQRQRVNIARALALDPKVLICDEAVSALDVSIQADILNLLVDLQQDTGIAYLFISHDIGVVSRVCNDIAVMYLGGIIERGPTADVVNMPAHPYTEALLSAEPQALPSRYRKREQILLEGELPSPLNPPTGCRFRTRCRYATELCNEPPESHSAAEAGHEASCHFVGELALRGTTHVA